MSRVLVIRLSALGDVAMLVPVLYSAAKKYPDHQFFLLTKSPLIPVFEYKPSNVEVIPVFTKDQNKGLKGLWRLIKSLFSYQIDQVADLHDVLRSQQIRHFLRLKGVKTAVIDKGRAEKRALVRHKNKCLVPLKTSIERYKDVFSKLGFEFEIQFNSIFEFGERDFSKVSYLTGEKKGKWIGIAPFAKHEGKTYPLEKMESVIRELSSNPEIRIFLFGGKEEKQQFETWAEQFKNVISVAGHFTFSSELLLMSYLDLMITMDSGNMHLASLVGTKVVSIWGATHPYAGFYGYGQDPENIVQVEMFCRPCSVFGNKPCYRKNYACMYEILPEMILEKVKKLI